MAPSLTVRPKALEHHFAWSLDCMAESGDAAYYQGNGDQPQRSLFMYPGLPMPHGAAGQANGLAGYGYIVIAELWCSRPDVELVLSGDGKVRVFVGPWLVERRPPAPYEAILYAPGQIVDLRLGRCVTPIGWVPVSIGLRVIIRSDAPAIEPAR